MKYLIKIEDKENNRDAMIECPANMLLEDFNITIKSELHLPCSDEVSPCFQMNGKVYVPQESVITELWGYYDDMYLPTDRHSTSNQLSEQKRYLQFLAIQTKSSIHCQRICNCFRTKKSGALV